MHRIIYSMVCLLLIGSYLFSCSKTDEDDGGTAPSPLEKVKSFQSIIKTGTIPSDLVNYDDMSEEIFSNYTPGAMVVDRYVKETGTGDGSSWANAANDIKAMIDGINDASENKVYVIMVASGTYKPNDSYVMKKHVALVGGFFAGSYDWAGETRLDGNNDERVFDNNDLDQCYLFGK